MNDAPEDLEDGSSDERTAHDHMRSIMDTAIVEAHRHIKEGRENGDSAVVQIQRVRALTEAVDVRQKITPSEGERGER